MPPHIVFTQSSTSGLANVDTFLFASQIGHGILRTSLLDTGWTLMNLGLDNKSVQDLIAVGTTLYAATFGGGVFVSTNLGNSWNVLYDNAGMDDHKAFSLAANSTTLFAGTFGTNSIPDTGVAYRTAFGGMEWTRINQGFIRNGVHLEQVFSMAAVDTLVFAGTDDVGLLRSTDNGDQWVPVGGFWGDIYAIKIAGPTVYYATAFSGVYRSLDVGQTWSANNTGFALGNMTLPSIVKDFLVAGQTIYAASDIGVFKQSSPGLITGNQTPGDTPAQASLSVSPNPVSSGTTLECYIPGDGFTSLRLFDAYGKEVERLLHGELLAGVHAVDFDGTGLMDGCYFAVLETGGKVVCRQFLVVR